MLQSLPDVFPGNAKLLANIIKSAASKVIFPETKLIAFLTDQANQLLE
jgi:hypothetical protein